MITTEQAQHLRRCIFELLAAESAVEWAVHSGTLGQRKDISNRLDAARTALDECIEGLTEKAKEQTP